MTKVIEYAGAASPPASLRASALGCRPVFIIGCERSGTTLLRLMLDSHPSLAIPDESHFIVDLYSRLGIRRSPAATLERVLADPRFRRWGLDPSVVRRLAAVAPPATYPEVMQTVFAAYAGDRGKPRWGDKTPAYTARVPLLARLFPSAQFVHIIRDGREVAASISAQQWGPGTPVAAARSWQRRVSQARQAAAELPPERYLELRLEELTAEPESVLRTVCRFLDEPFAAEMLEYHRTAHERIWTGTPGDREYIDHRHLSSPPILRTRDWRAGLVPGQRRAVEAAAQPLLGELGYGGERASLPTVLRVQAALLRDMPRALERKFLRRARGLYIELRSRALRARALWINDRRW